MAETRTPEESASRSRPIALAAGNAVERLRGEVTKATDWRGHLDRHRKEVLIGAAVAGFVLGGGIAGDDRPAHGPSPLPPVLLVQVAGSPANNPA